MRNLYDIINESYMICEAFKDPRLYQIARSLQKQGSNFNKVFEYGQNIAWDKIDSSDIEEIYCYDNKAVENVLKQVRRLIASKEERPFVLFGMKNEELGVIYDPHLERLGYVTNSKYFSWNGPYLGGSHKMKQNEQFNYLRYSDYLLKVYIDNNYVRDLVHDRNAAKDGAWIMTKNDHESKHLNKGVLGKDAGGRSDWTETGSFYNMCDNMAYEAVKRWKKIVAENKFKKSDDTSKIDNAVENIMSRITKATTNAMKDPVKYSKYDLDTLMKSIYKENRWIQGSGVRNPGHYASHDELLVCYSKYCNLVMSIKTNTSYNLPNDLKEKESYEKIILEKVSKIDELLKKFNA